ncbi:O-acetyl transferase [Listeria cornellensis FSL F6-0969]|uniref:O-acetyl transferase n=1 Tax=Listeria cornellensis FSL F6-0969 TaxID=1265820 RepID=W7BXJ7_9LIST|nr:O-acetyl transferase [Listeria cornellensis FSL F6-0969]
MFFYGLVFYYVGQLLKDNKIFEWCFSSNFKVTSMLLLCIGLNIIFGFILNSRVSVYSNQLGNYLWFYIAAISGCLALFIIFKGSPSYRMLMFIGVNSIVVMSTHYFFVYGFDIVDTFVARGLLTIERSLWISVVETAFVFLCSVPLCYFFNKYLPMAVGKKNTKKIS